MVSHTFPAVLLSQQFNSLRNHPYSTNFDTDNIILLGDFNSYSLEPPITEITSNGYSSMVQGDYSYVFSGQWGKLDHVFIKNDALSALDASAVIWHCNADELDYIDYNLDYGRDAQVFDPAIPERFSDHDPIIVALNFNSSKAHSTSAPSASPNLQIDPTASPPGSGGGELQQNMDLKIICRIMILTHQ